jgi:hypothetical protein
MGGSNMASRSGVYGTLASPASGNAPGGREGANNWTDNGGNVWLFGGYGFDSTPDVGLLNDLWEFTPSTRTWTWMAGSNTASQPGTYGTFAVPAAGNVPGSRDSAVSWTDSSGNLWLFGGNGLDSFGTMAELDDLWKYQPPVNASTLKLAISAMQLTFGPQTVGTQSAAQYLTITNFGKTAATFSSGLLDSSDGDFQITDQSGSCSTSMVLQPARKCVVRVTYTPSAAGPGNALWSPQFSGLSVALTGTGVLPAPQFTCTPSSLVFPSAQLVGSVSPAQYVLITSTGTSALELSGVTLAGADPGDFAVSNQAGACATATPATPASLAYHAECNLRVLFTPTAAGTRSAILSITDNVTGSPQQVPLTGTAIAGAQLSLSATTLTFPTTAAGSTAATQYLTLKSTGFQPVVISQVLLSPGDFALSDQAGTCTTAATTSLIPGASCNIRVKFHPQATGSHTVIVTINDNTAAGSHLVTLSGMGM